MQYKCIKNFQMEGGETAFSQGKVYNFVQGFSDMSAKDDLGNDYHYMDADEIAKYFRPHNSNALTITIENPENVTSDLADLLCWYEGFRLGLSIGSNSEIPEPVAWNGIEAARKLNLLIKNEINRIQK